MNKEAYWQGWIDGVEEKKEELEIEPIEIDLEEFKRYCEEQSRFTMVRLWDDFCYTVNAVWERVYIFFTEFR